MFIQPDRLPSNYDQHFKFIRRNDLDQQLSTIFRHWDATPVQRAEFVGWAWVVAAVSDFVARTEGAGQAMDGLGSEREEVLRVVADQLTRTATFDLHLVSKRMFLDWLCSELAVARAAA